MAHWSIGVRGWKMVADRFWPMLDHSNPPVSLEDIPTHTDVDHQSDREHHRRQGRAAVAEQG